MNFMNYVWIWEALIQHSLTYSLELLNVKYISSYDSLLKYSTKDSTMADGVDTTQNPEKDLIEKEKATLKKLLPLLENFVREKVDLQVSGVRSFTS